MNRSTAILGPIVSFIVAGSNLVYDPADGYLVRFGGGIPYYLSPDTWTYSNGQWSNISASAGAPPARIFGTMTYDYADHSVLLFGGASLSSSNLTELGDTWSFSAGHWKQLHPATSPAPREGAGMVYDPIDGYVVLFGGGNNTLAFNDTWTFSGGNWTQLHPTSNPGSRVLFSMAYDSFSTRVVLFGGTTVSTSGGATPAKSLNDTWSFVAGAWAPDVTTRAPSARYEYSMANDTGDGTLVLTGGTNGSTDFNDTWSFFAGAWTSLSSAHAPTNRYPTEAAYDDQLSRVVLVAPVFTRSLVGGQLWGFAAGNWKLLGFVGYPGPLFAEGLAENASSGTALLFGGLNVTGLQPNTWRFHHDLWEELPLAPSPSARGAPGLTYDSDLGGFLLFGGSNSTTFFNDTWVFRGGGWQPLAPPGPVPNGRDFASLTFDPALHAAILFGGSISSSRDVGDTWAFESVNGSFRWVNWTSSAGPGPAPRAAAGATFDARMNDLVLFGGDNSTGARFNDTWLLAPSGKWSRLASTAGPSARNSMGFAYDPAIDEDVLVGGANSTVQLSDTWELGAMGWTLVTPSARPPALQFVPLIFDATTRTMYAYGGLQTTPAPVTVYLFGTSWFFDPLRTTVSANQSGGVVPTAVSYTSATTGGSAPLRYAWSLGNGSTASTANVSHEYLQPGTYVIQLLVTDAFGVVDRVSVTETMTGMGIAPLLAHLTASPTSGAAPLTVDLAGSATGGEGPYQFAWNLGDGSSSTAENVTHSYAAGSYRVTLNVTDRLGGVSSGSVLIIASPRPLTVHVGLSASSGSPPLTVYFSVTEGGGTPPYTLAWTFGDGTRATGSVSSHTYASAGSYTTQVVIKDQSGASNSTSFTVAVTMGASPSGGNSSSLFPWWTLPGIIALAAVAAAVGYRFWRGRRVPPQSQEGPAVEPVEDPSSGLYEPPQ